VLLRFAIGIDEVMPPTLARCRVLPGEFHADNVVRAGFSVRRWPWLAGPWMAASVTAGRWSSLRGV
jgi:hypothetical protein